MGGLGRILKAEPRLYVGNNCLQDALASLLLNVREDEAGESVWISQRREAGGGNVRGPSYSQRKAHVVKYSRIRLSLSCSVCLRESE